MWLPGVNVPAGDGYKTCPRSLLIYLRFCFAIIPNGYEKALRGAAGVLVGPIVIIVTLIKRENSIVMSIQLACQSYLR